MEGCSKRQIKRLASAYIRSQTNIEAQYEPNNVNVALETERNENDILINSKTKYSEKLWGYGKHTVGILLSI